MFRASEIQEKLLHLIGWKQSYNTEEVEIVDSLTESETGLYFQQAHPLLTLQNLASIAPIFREFEEQTVVEQFSIWLEDKTKGSIQKAISRFYNEKIANGAAKALCESKTLFDGTGRLIDLVKNQNNIVGFEIVPVRALGVTTKINKIGLQFTKAGKYILYLMHSSSDEPVQIIELEKKKDNTMEWFTMKDLYLPYQSENIDAGGSWYLVYIQSSLPEGAQAIKKNKDWSKGPCGTCSRAEILNWKAWSKYLEIHPFKIAEELCNIDTVVDTNKEQDENTSVLHMWDVEKNTYTYDTNYGINLEVTVSCDYTDFIIEQRSIFQDIIMKQVAVDMLREFAYNANTRTNRHSINASKMDILVALDGASEDMGKSGLTYELDMAIKAIKLNTQGIDRVCLPCINNGVKYRAI